MLRAGRQSTPTRPSSGRILRDFDASLAEPKEVQDHADLKIFLQDAAVSETWRVRRRWTRPVAGRVPWIPRSGSPHR